MIFWRSIKNYRKLKKDESVDIALKQIKEVLAVAICYDSKLKEHKCKIEKI